MKYVTPEEIRLPRHNGHERAYLRKDVERERAEWQKELALSNAKQENWDYAKRQEKKQKERAEAAESKLQSKEYMLAVAENKLVVLGNQLKSNDKTQRERIDDLRRRALTAEARVAELRETLRVSSSPCMRCAEMREKIKKWEHMVSRHYPAEKCDCDPCKAQVEMREAGKA